ncbi:MAG: hypothetical protein JRD89_01825 [Deltaproteobacteria bacterium]|nr:hypothetical protein [Deltaproteobacteria bacterium]
MSLKLHQSVKFQPAIRPQAAAAGTVNGLSIDRLGFEDAVLLVSVGAVSGGPTAQTVDVKIQDSADGTTWADVPGLTVEQITAGDTYKELGINLSPLRRYIRAVATVAFTEGTTPTIQLAVDIALGKSRVEPV